MSKINDDKKEFVTVNNLKRFLQNADERFAPNKNMEGIKSDGSGGYIAGKSGLVPAPSSSSNGKFLRSDGTWAAPGESSVYNTMDVAEGTAGTSTTDRVINAKNLKEIISSQVPTKVSELDNDRNFLTSSDLSAHTSNKNIHVTSTEKTTWNNKQNALTTQQINNINAVPDKANASDLTSHTDDTDIHVTPTEKTTWNNKANKATTLSGYGITDAYTKSQVDKKVSDLVNSAPETLDTLNELASALGNDPNFATTVANQIGTKADDNDVVHKTGNETIAGTKTFSETRTKFFKSLDLYHNEDYKLNTNPSVKAYQYVFFTSKSGWHSAFLENQVDTDGASYCNLSTRNTNEQSAAVQLAIDSNGVKTFKPATNNDISLGASTSKWKDVYATTFHGDIDFPINEAQVNEILGIA